ncbi:MAG: CCA tRNA nucleotidyltransferase, mitochondrial [Geoglossum umbratile]|nr:MAG: CCA tRNA nucleotidyltransferase, mitochondrial [Geoglossum umbratile]
MFLVRLLRPYRPTLPPNTPNLRLSLHTGASRPRPFHASLAPSEHDTPEVLMSKRRKLSDDSTTALAQNMSTPQAPTYGPHVQLELTPVEGILCRLLTDVAEYVDGSPTQHAADSELRLPDALAQSKVELRFTGGWVRDKLLGTGSQDIDVSINKMTGYQFGLKMKEYLAIPGNKQKYGLEEDGHVEAVSTVGGGPEDSGMAATADAGHKVTHRGLGGLHRIEANPEKSKHLETVTTKILGLDIDLVNLRKETYYDDSRNPQMEFGTPEEDALRRDATVNALFYNLHTLSVEDFTGRGFDDMEHKIIRTPMEPYQTFTDDPLRVLRLIRFASRLDFRIDYETERSMASNSIKAALRAKISRERVGTEIEKTLKGLYDTIFTDPTNDMPTAPDLNCWQQTYQFLHSTLHDADHSASSATNPRSRIQSMLIRGAEEAYLAWLLAALTPWANLQALPTGKPGRKKLQPMAATVAREGLKVNNKVLEVIVGACTNGEEITKLISDQEYSPEKEGTCLGIVGPTDRSALGMAIRRWGYNWRYHVLFALLLDLKRVGNGTQEMGNVLANYAAFLQHLEKLGILEAHLLKPLVDGNRLCQELHAQRGPWIKGALEVVMEWQLKHPDQADPQAAVMEVEKRRTQLGIT